MGVAADSHGDWKGLDEWAAAHRLDVVVHCGDAGPAEDDGILVLSARGNHEMRAPSGARPLYVPDYQMLELGGLTWLFLGCCSAGGDVATPPADLPRADVLVSHEAPFNPHMGWEGHPVVHRVVHQVKPRWCFSGHWHHLARGRVGATECLALGADPKGWLVYQIQEGELCRVTR